MDDLTQERYGRVPWRETDARPTPRHRPRRWFPDQAREVIEERQQVLCAALDLRRPE